MNSIVNTILSNPSEALRKYTELRKSMGSMNAPGFHKAAVSMGGLSAASVFDGGVQGSPSVFNKNISQTTTSSFGAPSLSTFGNLPAQPFSSGNTSTTTLTSAFGTSNNVFQTTQTKSAFGINSASKSV